MMGALGLESMLAHGSEEAALLWHLTSNHFPPIPSGLVPAAKRAIRYAKAGKWETRVSLKPFATWKGQPSAPVHEIVKAWHLDQFIMEEA